MGLFNDELEFNFKVVDGNIVLTYKNGSKQVTTTVATDDYEDPDDVVRNVLNIALELLESDSDSKDEEPYLYDDRFGVGIKYNRIGKETKYKDAIGRKLHVGDVVTIIIDGEIEGEEYVVYDPYIGRDYIMGIECICDSETGEIKEDNFKFLLNKKYTQVTDGEYHGGLEACLHG